jgi:hypothetical protein
MKRKIKKVVLSIFLLVSFSTVGQTEIYETSSTTTDNIGNWTKIASARVAGQYGFVNATILFAGGTSSNSVANGKLFFRVKQQDPLGQAPYVQLELLDSNGLKLSNENIVAVISRINTIESIVDLYVRITNSWERIYFTSVLERNTSRDRLNHYSHQPFIVELPNGASAALITADAQIVCKGLSTTFSQENVGIGEETREDVKLYVKSTNTKIGIQSSVEHTTDWNFGIMSAVNREKTNAFSVLLKQSDGSYVDKFSVLGNGKIYGTGLNLTIPLFADYVFAEDYELMPLNKLEKFIKKHKHLPNMPSEKELVSKGMDVVNMQVLQTEKIEELTLYIIQQEKRIKELEDLLDKKLEKVLKKKIKEILKSNNNLELKP